MCADRRSVFNRLSTGLRVPLKSVKERGPLVAVTFVSGEDGLQIWRVAAHILNKKSQTADEGLYSSLEVGRGANNSLP
jgi:hypothetical protein